MVGKVLFVACLLAALSPVYPSVLHRDVRIDQSARPNLEELLAQIESSDIRGDAINFVFGNAEAVASNLSSLFSSKSKPEVSEVLNIFNRNFGSNLLVINEDSVQVDPKAYERFLSNRAMSLTRTVFPNSGFEQLMVYGVLQQQIRKHSDDIRPEIESKKIPLEQLNAVIATNGNPVALRSLVEQKDLLGDVVSNALNAALESACGTLVNAAFSTLNSTLTSAITFLDSLSVSGSSNIVVGVISVIVDLLSQLVEIIREVVASFSSSICSELLGSSRKRREIADTALAEFGTRDIMTRDIFSTIFDWVWSLVAGLLNTYVKSLAADLIDWAQSYIDDFLSGTLTDWVNSLIDSVLS